MAYIVAGIFAIFCTAVIVFGLRVFKENRKMGPKKNDRKDDDEISF
jgi:hypothetical protein